MQKTMACHTAQASFYCGTAVITHGRVFPPVRGILSTREKGISGSRAPALNRGCKSRMPTNSWAVNASFNSMTCKWSRLRKPFLVMCQELILQKAFSFRTFFPAVLMPSAKRTPQKQIFSEQHPFYMRAHAYHKSADLIFRKQCVLETSMHARARGTCPCDLTAVTHAARPLNDEACDTARRH